MLRWNFLGCNAEEQHNFRLQQCPKIQKKKKKKESRNSSPVTHLASNARAMIPAASGADADVPV